MCDPAEINTRLLGAKHTDPPPFIGRLKDALAQEPLTELMHPYAVDEREARESIALTYGMISMVDDGIGGFWPNLMASVWPITPLSFIPLTMATSWEIMDHAEAWPTRKVIRMPMIWLTQAQAVGSDILTSAIDFMPSVLARAGLQPFTGVQGVDVVGLVQAGGSLTEPA